MTVAAVVATGAAVLATLVRRSPRRRLPVPPPDPGTRAPRDLRRPAYVAVLIAVGVLAWALGPVGMGAAAVLVGAGVLRRGRTRAPTLDVAVVADLVAACVQAGAAIPDALAAAAAAAPADARDVLLAAARELSRGGSADEVGEAMARRLPPFAGAGRALARGAGTGASIAAELRREAARSRATRRAAVQAQLHRRAVWMVLPVGTCFLPAFVLTGIVPLLLATLPVARG